jgi:hypothetical protein
MGNDQKENEKSSGYRQYLKIMWLKVVLNKEKEKIKKSEEFAGQAERNGTNVSWESREKQKKAKNRN